MAAESPSPPNTDTLFWPAAGLILGLGAFLRLFRVGEQLILDDEWHALNAVQDHDYAWIFSHLGEADHSIPVTLLYELFSQTIGLGELSMRFPSLLAGILVIAALPWLWRRWLGPGETLLFAGLIAISPFLINYSRIARPYALLALLAGASLVLAWRWWQSTGELERNSWRSGLGWLVCAVLAAWINPVSLAVTAGPFLWFASCAAGSALRRNSWRPLLRLAAMGLAMTVAVAALMYIPLASDFGSLAIKARFHQAGPGTFLEAITLFAGSGQAWAILLMAAAAILGWVELWGRDREFSFYLLIVALASTVAVTLTGAAWISYGLVLARYLIGLLPVFLALAAIGLATTCSRTLSLTGLSAAYARPAFPLALLVLFLAGPLPHAGAGYSQFMHHMSLQFDYDFERNPVRVALETFTPDAFYAEIAQLHPQGDAVIVEAPWYLESNWNALPLNQAIHRQRVMAGFVGGLCAEKLYGELRQDAPGLEFRNFTRVKDVLDGKVRADFLVLRIAPLPGAREVAVDYPACERAARTALGEPWRSTPSALVFRLSGAS
jgi:hypothetical protein